MAAVTLANATDAFGTVGVLLQPFKTNFTSLSGEVWSTYTGTPSIATSAGPFSDGAYYPELTGVYTPHSAQLELQTGPVSTPVGSFTIEFWYYREGFGGTVPLIYKGDGVNRDFEISRRYSSPYEYLDVSFGDAVGNTTVSTLINDTQVPYNTWHHYAFVVSVAGGVNFYRLFIDGVLRGQATLVSLNNIAHSQTGTNLPLYVGANPSNAAGAAAFADLRITKAARYVTNFTPPTARFGYGSGWAAASATASLVAQPFLNLSASIDEFADKVVSMHHFSGVSGTSVFEDQTGKVWTPSALAPILEAGWVSPVSANTYYDTVYRNDSSGVYLTTPNHASLNMSDGSSFTIEAWVRLTATSSVGSLIFGKDTENSGGSSYALHLSSSRYLAFFAYDTDAAQSQTVVGTGRVTLSVWTHVAMSYSAAEGLYRTFMDGVLQAEAFANFPIVDKGSAAWVGGCSISVNRSFKGQLDEVRVTKGVARYTTGFSRPTRKFGNSIGSRATATASLLAFADTVKQLATTAAAAATLTPSLFTAGGAFVPLDAAPASVSLITAALATGKPLGTAYITDPYRANVVAMFHFDGAPGGATIVDETGKVLSGINAHADLSVTAPKFGSAAMYFDGVAPTELVVSNSSTDFAFGTGDFTVECWVKRGIADTTGRVFFADGSSSGAGVYSIAFNLTSFNDIKYTVLDAFGGALTGNRMLSSNALPGVWTHLALVRSGTTFYSFADGVLQETVYDITASLGTSARSISLGGYTDYATGAQITIDELRITKGVARYTTAFAPQRAAFSSDTYSPPGAASIAPANLLVFGYVTLAATAAAASTPTAALSAARTMAAAAQAASLATPALLVALPGQHLLQAVPVASTQLTAQLALNVRLAATAQATMTVQAFLVPPQAIALAGGDEHFSNVTALVKFDGTEGSTLFVNSKGLAPVVYGGAHLTTAQARVGTASFSPDAATNDGLDVTFDSPALGNGDFTIEFWYREAAHSPRSNPTGIATITITGDTGFNGLMFRVIPNNGEGIGLDLYQGPGYPVYESSITSVPATEHWFHIAICRSGTHIYTVTDGKTNDNGYITTASFGTSASISINSIAGLTPFFIDDFRVTQGVARYPYQAWPRLEITPTPGDFPDYAGGGTLVASAQVVTQASLTVSRDIAAAATSTSVLTAALRLEVGLAAAAVAASSMYVGIGNAVLFAAPSAASQTTAELHIGVSLAASAAAASTLSVQVPVSVTLRAWPRAFAYMSVADPRVFVFTRAYARSFATPELQVYSFITLSASAVSSATADPALSARTSQPLAAAAVSAPLCTSDLGLRVGLACAALSTDTLTATLKRGVLLSAAVQSRGSLTSDVMLARGLAASAVSATVVTAPLLQTCKLHATGVCGQTVTGSLHLNKLMHSTCSGAPTSRAALRVYLTKTTVRVTRKLNRFRVGR